MQPIERLSLSRCRIVFVIRESVLHLGEGRKARLQRIVFAGKI